MLSITLNKGEEQKIEYSRIAEAQMKSRKKGEGVKGKVQEEEDREKACF